MGIHRRGLLVAAGATAAVASAARAATDQGPSKAWVQGGGGKYGQSLESLRRYVEQHRADFGLPGLTLCVVDADGYAGFITSGWADVERREPVSGGHVFQIGSITKSMVALCIYRLVQAGKIRLDQDVREILPEVQIDTTEKVTLARIVDHSAGLPGDSPLFPRATDGRLWLGYKPHSHWSYSNLGYDLLGKVIERVEGKTFERVCEEQVLRPLGMGRAIGAIRSEDRALYATGYSPYHGERPYPRRGRLDQAPWLDVTFAAGCVAATPQEMAKYARWVMAAARGKGSPLLTDELAKRYTEGSVDAPGWAKDAKYGAGWATVKVDGRSMLHHTGGMVAFSSSIHMDPEAGIACFASTNVGSTGYRPRAITAYACQLFRAAREGGKSPTPAPTAVKVEAPEKSAGRFTAAGGDWIELKPGGPSGLQLAHKGGSAMLEAAGEDAFLAHDPRFDRHVLALERKDGKIVAAWYGETEYAADPAKLRGPAKAELRALSGRYDNDDPWLGTFRVYARPTGLFLGATTALTQLESGAWRTAEDDWNPERIWFDAPLNGRTQRLSYSGTDFLRRDDRA